MATGPFCFPDQFRRYGRPHRASRSSAKHSAITAQTCPFRALFFPYFFLFLTFIVSGLSFTACRPFAAEQDTSIVFPNGFQGFAYIYLNEACGSTAIHENAKQVFRVPADGALIVQDSSFAQKDTRKLLFYQSAADGQLQLLQPYEQADVQPEAICYFIAEFGKKHSAGISFSLFRVCIGTSAQIKAAFDTGRPAAGTGAALQKLKNCRQIINN